MDLRTACLRGACWVSASGEFPEAFEPSCVDLDSRLDGDQRGEVAFGLGECFGGVGRWSGIIEGGGERDTGRELACVGVEGRDADGPDRLGAGLADLARGGVEPGEFGGVGG